MATKIRGRHVASALLGSALVAGVVVMSASCLVEEVPADGSIHSYAPIEDLRAAEPKPQRVVYNDSGELCLFSNGAPEVPFGVVEDQEFEAGDRIVFRVMAPECLSTSCDTERVASCDIQQRGNNIQITSALAYTHQPHGMCTLDCGKLAATCESGPLAEGTYRVTLGHRSKTLTVPSTTTSCVPDDQCETDADCDGYCGWGDGGQRVCKAYVQQGDHCSGYLPPGDIQMCAPGLACITNSQLPDLPGVCWPTCNHHDDCASGLCLEAGDYKTRICVMTSG